MILYHFCAKKHIKSILRQGLTEGMLAEPTAHGFRLYSGYTWLTADPDPGRQSCIIPTASNACGAIASRRASQWS